MWEQSLHGIQDYLITTTKSSHLQFVAELPQGIGNALSPKMDHLVCFLPGSIALGATGGLTVAAARKIPGFWSAEKDAQMQLAKELMKTCWGMYAVTATGLAPEIAWFEASDSALRPRAASTSVKFPASKNSKAAWKKDYIIKPLDAHNLQRPETVESLFMLYRITQEDIYREWGWAIFKAFRKYGVTEDGMAYTSLDNVNAVPPPRRDNMESFWLVSKTSPWLKID
jgi:endoplasmic reticulum Man9GlcNAc2 1,2-alpha-mannosidase